MKLVWFRNDLRMRDHHALFNACQDADGSGVTAVVVISPAQWLLQDEANARVQFWLANVCALAEDLAGLNIPLKVLRAGSNREVPAQLLGLAKQLGVTGLYFNNEYPEYEARRDLNVESAFVEQGMTVRRFDSDVILPPQSLRNKQGTPFKVFTPFSKAWRARYVMTLPEVLAAPKPQAITSVMADPIPDSIHYNSPVQSIWREDLWPAGSEEAHQRLEQFVHSKSAVYNAERDFLAKPATSALSPYLSVGAISARQCLAGMAAMSGNDSWFDDQWVTELIWREFYRHLLVDYPDMNRWMPFKPDIESRLQWDEREELFDAWCRGETGFALVDAGMKQLLETGWMHNRARMVTASFLCKLLRQDWRRGARFFMQHLIDGDFASNLGGWQWSASVGADAAPYFRIFNPMRQAERFDPKGEYAARWLPELASLAGVQRYDPLFSSGVGRPTPVIDYSFARQQSIDQYKQAGDQRK